MSEEKTKPELDFTDAPQAFPYRPQTSPATGSIVAAIANAMLEIPKLGKTEKNKFSNYDFVSVDGFLEAVRPVIAKHGIVVTMNEEGFEQVDMGDKAWLRMRFAFDVLHSSGESLPTQYRTAAVQASMGSQAYGAAQSYALKQFLRAMFMVATGEPGVDADSHPQTDLPKDKGRFGKKPPSKSPSPMPVEGADKAIEQLRSLMETGLLTNDEIAAIQKECGAPKSSEITEETLPIFKKFVQAAVAAAEERANTEKA